MTERDAEVEQLREALEELQRAKDEMAADFEETKAEIYTGWRFQADEFDAERFRLRGRVGELEARVQELQFSHAAELAARLPEEEAWRRHRIAQEERATNMHKHFARLRAWFLGRGMLGNKTLHIGNGLYQLWLCTRQRQEDAAEEDAVCPPLPSPAMRVLLSTETHITRLFFNTAGMEQQWYDDAFDMPRADIRAFMGDIVCRLPALRVLAIMSAPDMEECCLPWVGELPASLERLWIRSTPYTVATLLRMVAARPGLQELEVSDYACVDWGDYTREGDDDEEEDENGDNGPARRRRRVSEASHGVITWC